MQKMQSNNIEKVVINVGVGSQRGQAHFDEKILPEIESEMARITGQKPSRRTSRKSEAGFKMRAGDVVGLKVTLRRRYMQDFLSRLINIILPRVRDFRGLDPKIIDKEGNLNIGLTDQFAFPEVDPNTSKVSFGLQITVVPKVRKKRKETIDIYRSLGVPLKTAT
jgi:large subunit ribosomal protein L5